MLIARIIDLGLVPYRTCTEFQLETLEKVARGDAPNTLIVVQHPPVLTLGASFHEQNLLLSKADYERRGIEVYRTERGGDVTYHGPGQLVIYPIFNLLEFGKDLHLWLRNLEECMLLTLAKFGLKGRRFPPHTGAWIDDRKVAAIGVKVRKWVSMHGVALNCDNDLAPFQLIVPCGISGYGVTSLSEELGHCVGVDEAKEAVLDSFAQVFDLSTQPAAATAGER